MIVYYEINFFIWSDEDFILYHESSFLSRENSLSSA